MALPNRIVHITRDTLGQIKNPRFAAYAAIYLGIYDRFMEQMRGTGIEIDTADNAAELAERRERLGRLGAVVRNDSKSLYINAISPACEACRLGAGSATFFISLKCHRDCFYCFNPNQENYDQFAITKKDPILDLEQIRASGMQLNHVALTGGEPLLYKQEAVAFFQSTTAAFPAAYKRLYTSGDQVEDALLQELKDARLDEIRFSIRMHDSENARRHTFDRIALAKQYIPNVMVEMPVLPGTLETMKGVLRELDRLSISSINLLEFCFPMNNAAAFQARGYKIKKQPFRVLYDYWYAGGLPIAGSELECLDLMEFALQEKLKIGVHYCSLENKHTGQIYQQNSTPRASKIGYLSQKDYFIKSAKVFGADIAKAKRVFKQIGYDDYQRNRDHDFLEFHVNKIQALAELDVEVAISSSVMETRADGEYLRELQVDLTYPNQFDLAADV
jgi:uncharacterized protein